MFFALIAVSLVAPASTVNILFLGNSHTVSHNLPHMVKSLIESSGNRTTVHTKVHSTAFLSDLATSAALQDDLRAGKWDIVMMQGAKLSSSHKYQYDHSGAVSIAKLAQRNKVKPYLFAEWPRRGWDETAYILREYGKIATPSGATIIPVCSVWDAYLKSRPSAQLWAADGNHATLAGSYLAASTLAAWLSTPGQNPKYWVPKGLNQTVAEDIMRTAQAVRGKSR